jgi:diguanylate cyclase (GGDEF)-like protein/PAS domain S-box-containing protein
VGGVRRKTASAKQDSVAPVKAPSLAAMLGLRPLPAALAERLHVTQFAAVDRLIALRTVLGLASIVFVVATYWHSSPHWLLGLWSFASVAGAAFPFFSHLGARRGDTEERASAAIGMHMLQLVVQGALWSAPMILLAPYGGPFEFASLWTMSTCLMVAVAIGFYVTPLAALMFLLVVGGASVVMMMHAGSSLLALTVASFTLLLTAACMRQAQLFGLQVTIDSQLTEKQETVSMLLREYDDTAADWLWQTDASRRLTGVTPYFARMMGIEAADIEGKSFLEILAGPSWQSGTFDPALRDLAAKLKAREAFTNLAIPVEVGGVRRWWELSASPRLDERGVFLGFRGVGSDVTEQQESAERIHQLAKFDLLTQLPNRLHLTDSLGEAMDTMAQWNTRCAFLMIDLDRFKSVNDTLGHQVGDLLLAQVAERLRSVCSENEICGRLGGDEFAVVIKDVPHPVYIEQVANAIIDQVSRPYEVEQNRLFIGASVGSATAPRDGRTPDTLIRSADLAMYRSKEDGGGKHFAYIASLHADAEERRLMEIALRTAIDQGQLYLEYQPVIELATGRLVSFEALVRWQHPQFGLVSPAKFIPLAEEARLIGAIGEWVLRTACDEAAGWPEQIGIAVNMSTEQLYDPEIVTKVISAVTTSGLEPRRLEIEVTESVFMREGSNASKLLDKLMSFGIRLSLDDFGTGYSSLGYLSRARFNTIKIDRCFVQGAARNEPESLAILNAVVAMSASLGMVTVAEGVETEQQLKVVSELGCTKVQGFYFGRPMRAEDARQLFSSPSAQFG